jgi:hypothetical protein
LWRSVAGSKDPAQSKQVVAGRMIASIRLACPDRQIHVVADELGLDAPYQARVLSLRRLIDAFTFEIDILAKRTAAQLVHHRATGRSRPSPAWAGYWVRCSWPRSAT